MIVTLLVITVVILALFFTYTNGFQDGSSVTAAAIVSRAMTPLQAIVIVSLSELSGALCGGSAVAHTVEGITSFPARISLLPVLISGLLAAIVWNYLTRFFRFPSSSTHALVGGLVGALYAESGNSYIIWGQADIFHPTGVCKLGIALFLSPLIGFVAGSMVYMVMSLLMSRATMQANVPIKWLQWPFTALLAFAHGANDPQKSMGIIMLAFYAAGFLPGNAGPVAGHGIHAVSYIPWYVHLASGLAMMAGVASLAPGIVRRVGTGIYRLRNLHALSAEMASSAVVLFGSLSGGPVSTSQVISCTVIGVGSTERIKGVQWLVAKDMLLAWFLTIPCAALLSWAIHAVFIHWLELLLPQI